MTDASQEHKYGSSQSLKMENASFACDGGPLGTVSSNVCSGPQSADQQSAHRLHFSEKKQANETASVVACFPIYHVQFRCRHCSSFTFNSGSSSDDHQFANVINLKGESRCRRCLQCISSSSGSSSDDDQYADTSRPIIQKQRLETAVVAANRPSEQLLSRASSMPPQNWNGEDDDVNSPGEDDDDSPAAMAVGLDPNFAIEEDDAQVLDNQPYSIDEHGDCQLPNSTLTDHARPVVFSGPRLHATEDTYICLPKYSSPVEKKDYTCSSCKAILWPQSLQAYCGHRFCGKCRPQVEGGCCPVDGDEIPKGNIFTDIWCQREMLKHTVECGYGAELGCIWVGALENYEAHLTSCPAANSSLRHGCSHEPTQPPSGRQIDLEQIELIRCSFKRLIVEDTRSINGELRWKICGFSEAMENAITGEHPYLQSRFFYTSHHRSSYKMFARVYPNGDGVGKGSFLSVELVIKADDDRKLPWPFRQPITVTLLDHSAKAENVSEALSPDVQASSLPTIKAKRTMAVQCPHFASHAMLKQREFLKDNAMYIRIAVALTGLPTS